MGWQLLNQKDTGSPTVEKGIDHPVSSIEPKAFTPLPFP